MLKDFTFWLGVHMPQFMERTTVPLMVSRRTLARRTRLPRAQGPIVLDSGGFTELAMFGEWRTPIDQYVIDARRIVDETGHVVWVAPQDWMCEPFMLAKTGLDVFAHIQRTVTNYLDLVQRAPDVPWIPVLQGWSLHHYHLCADLYEAEGVNLASMPVVGLGSVCRRQATMEIEVLVRSLAGRGYRLHGFGMKRQGLVRCADALTSADSLAWSFDARRSEPLPGCRHRTCANCLPYGLHWRADTLSLVKERLRRPHQLPLAVA